MARRTTQSSSHAWLPYSALVVSSWRCLQPNAQLPHGSFPPPLTSRGISTMQSAARARAPAGTCGRCISRWRRRIEGRGHLRMKRKRPMMSEKVKFASPFAANSLPTPGSGAGGGHDEDGSGREDGTGDDCSPVCSCGIPALPARGRGWPWEPSATDVPLLCSACPFSVSGAALVTATHFRSSATRLPVGGSGGAEPG